MVGSVSRLGVAVGTPWGVGLDDTSLVFLLEEGEDEGELV